MPYSILAIDPGITTGYAMLTNDDFTSWQSKDTEYDLYMTLNLYDPDIIVCENFVFRQAKTKIELFPVQLIGVVNLFREVTDAEVIMQTPAQAKGFVKDRHLKALHFWNPKYTNHPNDAARHLVFYLATVLKDPKILEAFK